MNVLVTGGSGFIGSHIVDKLVEAGHSVRILDLKEPHRRDVEFLRGNITSEEDVRKSSNGINIIYHIGAFSNIDLVKSHPVTTINSNIMGTVCLLEECRRQNVQRFIFASSVFVHDERGHLYTTAKLASEMMCKNFNTLYGLPYTILRYGTAYGPRSRDADVISVFIRNALEGKDLVIYGSGEQKRHFIFIDDLAEGNLAALKTIATNRTYTMANPNPVTVNELAMIVKEIAGKDITIKYQPSREDDYQGDISDIGLAKEYLDWEPKVNIKEGITRYIEWFRKL
ncbi:NAD-dependent epimerase/dehydratase family protein [Chloroflexota bacterium]